MQDEALNNSDFKYIIQDTSHVYFGKELTYKELMEHNDVPFKMKAIISTYISKDVPLEKKLVDHLLCMDETGFSYQIFSQLKMEIRIFYKEEKKTLLKKTKEHWVHKTCTFASFVANERQAVLDGRVSIEDVVISKFALMLISI